MPRRTRRDKKRDSSNDNGDSGRSRGGRPPRVEPTGVIPECIEQLHEHGVELPAVVYDAARRRPAGANGEDGEH